MRVTFWGTRGSIAAPGPRTVRYGGNTSCVEVRTDDGTLLICDSGTGIRELGRHLLARGSEVHGHILISHTHWDHIQGWPFFNPALVKGNEFTLHALGGLHQSLEHVMANQMEYTYFPITLDAMEARIAFEETREGRFAVDRVRVTAHFLNHTSICLGYRIEGDGKTVVYASDTEPHGLTLAADGTPNPLVRGSRPQLPHEQDQQLAEFVRGADLLILDAQYTDEEYPQKIGWGHSTIGYATDIAVLGGVRRLALYHHDPTHDDDTIDRMVAAAAARVAAYGAEVRVLGAAEGLTVVV